MKLSDILKISVLGFILLLIPVFVLTGGGNIIDWYSLLLLLLLSILLILFLQYSPLESKPIIFILVFVTLACQAQRVLFLMLNPKLFLFEKVVILSPKTINPALEMLLLSTLVYGVGIIAAKYLVIRKPIKVEDSKTAHSKMGTLFGMRNYIIMIAFAFLSINLFGTLFMHSGVSATTPAPYNWIIEMFSLTPCLFLIICLLEEFWNDLNGRERLSAFLFLFSYAALYTMRSSRGTFVVIILSWLIVKIAREIDFKINYKQIIVVLSLLTFLVLFYAQTTSAIRRYWLNQENLTNKTINQQLYSSDVRFGGRGGLEWLSTRMNGLDPLIASVSYFHGLSLQKILPATDIIKYTVNNLVPGDIFPFRSMQLPLGQIIAVMFVEPKWDNYFREGKLQIAGNWGGIYSLAYAYAGKTGGLIIIFGWSIVAGLLFYYISHFSHSPFKLFYESLFLNLLIFSILQAGNPDDIVSSYLRYLIAGFIIIQIGRVWVAHKVSA